MLRDLGNLEQLAAYVLILQKPAKASTIILRWSCIGIHSTHLAGSLEDPTTEILPRDPIERHYSQFLQRSLHADLVPELAETVENRLDKICTKPLSTGDLLASLCKTL